MPLKKQETRPEGQETPPEQSDQQGGASALGEAAGEPPAKMQRTSLAKEEREKIMSFLQGQKTQEEKQAFIEENQELLKKFRQISDFEKEDSNLALDLLLSLQEEPNKEYLPPIDSLLTLLVHSAKTESEKDTNKIISLLLLSDNKALLTEFKNRGDDAIAALRILLVGAPQSENFDPIISLLLKLEEPKQRENRSLLDGIFDRGESGSDEYIAALLQLIESVSSTAAESRDEVVQKRFDNLIMLLGDQFDKATDNRERFVSTMFNSLDSISKSQCLDENHIIAILTSLLAFKPRDYAQQPGRLMYFIYRQPGAVEILLNLIVRDKLRLEKLRLERDEGDGEIQGAKDNIDKKSSLLTLIINLGPEHFLNEIFNLLASESIVHESVKVHIIPFLSEATSLDLTGELPEKISSKFLENPENTCAILVNSMIYAYKENSQINLSQNLSFYWLSTLMGSDPRLLSPLLTLLKNDSQNILKISDVSKVIITSLAIISRHDSELSVIILNELAKNPDNVLRTVLNLLTTASRSEDPINPTTIAYNIYLLCKLADNNPDILTKIQGHANDNIKTVTTLLARATLKPENSIDCGVVFNIFWLIELMTRKNSSKEFSDILKVQPEIIPTLLTMLTRDPKSESLYNDLAEKTITILWALSVNDAELARQVSSLIGEKPEFIHALLALLSSNPEDDKRNDYIIFLLRLSIEQEPTLGSYLLERQDIVSILASSLARIPEEDEFINNKNICSGVLLLNMAASNPVLLAQIAATENIISILTTLLNRKYQADDPENNLASYNAILLLSRLTKANPDLLKQPTERPNADFVTLAKLAGQRDIDVKLLDQLAQQEHPPTIPTLLTLLALTSEVDDPSNNNISKETIILLNNLVQRNDKLLKQTMEQPDLISCLADIVGKMAKNQNSSLSSDAALLSFVANLASNADFCESLKSPENSELIKCLKEMSDRQKTAQAVVDSRKVSQSQDLAGSKKENQFDGPKLTAALNEKGVKLNFPLISRLISKLKNMPEDQLQAEVAVMRIMQENPNLPKLITLFQGGLQSPSAAPLALARSQPQCHQQ